MSRNLNPPHVTPLHSAVPGRLRLQVGRFYRNEPLAHQVERRLQERAEVLGARANIYTSSLLIHYDPTAVDSARLTRWVGEALREPVRNLKAPLPGRQSRSKKAGDHAWHLLKTEDVLSLKKTSPKTGLSGREAKIRLAVDGPNQIPVSPSRSAWEIFSAQLTNLPTGLLLGAAGVSLLTGGVADAVMIVGVVLVNATVGYRTESAAEQIVNVLIDVKKPNATVLRDGKKQEVPAVDIVLGDILLLSPGDSVPADARLIHSNLLTADESLLTGESFPASKSPLDLIGLSAGRVIPLADRKNMLYCGTTVTGGNGSAVVVATGIDTEIGRVQELIGSSTRPQTSLQARLEVLSKRLAFISVSFAGTVMAIELIRGERFLTSLKSAVTLAVAAIPEGLPTVATTILAQGVGRLKENGILIRRIESVEDLGSVNLICLDKTGTLTLNRMKVVSIQTVSKAYTKATPVLRRSPEGSELLKVSVLCNEAEELKGSPTERALIEMAILCGLDISKLRKDYPLLHIRHRSENRGFMSTVHGISRLARKRSTASEQVFMAVKGSPQEVLQRCAWYLSQGKVQPMTQKIKNLVGNQNELMTGEALRVLGFAFKKSRLTRRGKASELAEDDLIWLGLVGMSDPPRAGVRKLIGKLQTAGIRPVMVTGDQGSTAVAIGKRLGLAGSEPLNVIESTRLEKVAPEVFSAMARQAHVFARVSPAHKLQIVQALQKQGNRVAMTGDGINDGPALKASHIGIAMGAGGTDVARKVADVVLMKDDLSSIVTAIREGRVVHENMRKATDYIVAQNLAEILLIFLSVASGLGEPLNPLQLLWVNLITDIFPELALAQEKPEKDILTKQPVAAGAPILPAEDIRRIILDGAFLTTASLGGYLYGVRKYGRGPQASTLAFVSINTASLFYTITARSKKVTIFDRNGLKSNPFIPAALGVGFSAEYLGAFLPVLRGVLGTARVQPLDLLLTAAGATLPLFGIEIIKFITSRLDSSESGDPLCKANMFSTQSP